MYYVLDETLLKMIDICYVVYSVPYYDNLVSGFGRNFSPVFPVATFAYMTFAKPVASEVDRFRP